MDYTFRVLSNEEEDFRLELMINADSSFSKLNKAVQKALKFDRREMCSFYLTNENWEKEIEITQMDITEDSEILNMDKCLLGDYLAKTGDRLLYVFDLFEERALNIELVEKNKEGSLGKAEVLLLEGKVPGQNKLPEIFPNEESDEDFGDDLPEDEGISFESIDDLDI